MCLHSVGKYSNAPNANLSSSPVDAEGEGLNNCEIAEEILFCNYLQ